MMGEERILRDLSLIPQEPIQLDAQQWICDNALPDHPGIARMLQPLHRHDCARPELHLLRTPVWDHLQPIDPRRQPRGVLQHTHAPQDLRDTVVRKHGELVQVREPVPVAVTHTRTRAGALGPPVGRPHVADEYLRALVHVHQLPLVHRRVPEPYTHTYIHTYIHTCGIGAQILHA